MKEEDKAKSTAVTKEQEEARHVIVLKMLDKAGSTELAYEDSKAKHVIMMIVAKEVNKPRSDAVV